MIKTITITSLVLSFVLFWYLIGKYPESIARVFPFMRNRIPSDQTLHVYSAETPDGKEAEFINDMLPERTKTIRFFRAILFTVYLFITIYLIFS